MILHNDTILRGYLAHLRSNFARLASLRGQAEMHRDNTPGASQARRESSSADEIRTEWEKLRADLGKVLQVWLSPFENVLSKGVFDGPDPGQGGPDPTRITFRELKRRADKARRKDPTITLLKSWDLAAKEKLAQECREKAAA